MVSVLDGFHCQLSMYTLKTRSVVTKPMSIATTGMSTCIQVRDLAQYLVANLILTIARMNKAISTKSREAPSLVPRL